MRKQLQLFFFYLKFEGSGFFLLVPDADICVKQCLVAEQWLHSTTQRASIFPFLFHKLLSAQCSDFAYLLGNQGVQRERKTEGKKKKKGKRQRREGRQTSKERNEASACEVIVGTLSSNDTVSLWHSCQDAMYPQDIICVSFNARGTENNSTQLHSVLGNSRSCQYRMGFLWQWKATRGRKTVRSAAAFHDPKNEKNCLGNY